MASGESGLVDMENKNYDRNNDQVTKEEEEDIEPEVRGLYTLYLSRCLAAWGDRLWQFVGSLFMLSLDHGSLQLVAVYGLASCLTVMVCGAWLGALVDRTSRMRMVTSAVVVQNLAVAVTCGLVAFYFNVRKYLSTNQYFILPRCLQ